MEGKSFLRISTSLCLALSAPEVDAARLAEVGLGSQSELRLMAGVMDGHSGEYVYDADGSGSGIPGYKVSELEWELDNVWMVGAAFTYRADWLHLNADVWTNAHDGDGTMSDYDWLYVGADWSHRSHHDNTTVNKVSRLDANAEFTMYGTPTDRLFGILGFRQDHLDWEARGGTAIYSVDGYRDTYLVFDDVLGISYKQTFRAPYLGLGYEAMSESDGVDIVLNASVRYSRWAEGEDTDIHHLRDLRFEEAGTGGTWMGYGLTLDFRTRSSFSFVIGYAYQKYDQIKGSTTVTDLVGGTQSLYPGDASGLDHRSRLLSLGLGYRF